MKKAEIEMGGRYVAKVAGRETILQINRYDDNGGWWATNEITGRQVRIKTAGRLRRPAPATIAACWYANDRGERLCNACWRRPDILERGWKPETLTPVGSTCWGCDREVS